MTTTEQLEPPGSIWQTGTRTFRQSPTRLDHDREQAAQLRAIPAIDGTGKPAALVTLDHHILRLLTREDAIRVANELVDAIERTD